MKMRLSDETSGKMANMGLFCAVLIVMLHAGWGGLTAIAVPWFFVASGYFLAGHVGEVGWWGREVRKRIRSLLIPMWIWGCVSLMIECGLIYGAGWIGYEYRGKELALSHRVLKCIGIVFTENMGPLWFLRMLFILVVISPILMCCNAVRLMMIALFAFAYGWFELSDLPSGRLWHFLEYGISLRGLLYFSIGGGCERFQSKDLILL